MVEDKQENPFEGAMSQLIKFISAKDDSTQLLISHLVSYLEEKGVIDIDDYLEYTEKAKDRLISKINNGSNPEESEQFKLAVQQTFNWHIEDFKKSEN
ncbi:MULTISPECIES: hypothetical protein [Acinetobacter]|jgi:hypothetical protein|uniref:Uncharacterized protein n=1 Tax=Acinetobacter pittii TaxID=48296 RepID=A0AAE9SA05_ACIPI|nr:MULTISPECIES: hypothetical protein [Acinetobacter]KCY67492.1 hypothetical protein J608_1741 [Acinetobacter baumannii 1288284]EXE92090.1 hypothetical protein J588_1329 [Acinetobacter sp. 1578804]EXS02865.1 hypothetical protein J687_0294 [Acinetobacter sp. 225588]KCX15995.1 hypothetical protein J723_1951 [Acinetobacter sp. 1264765]KQD31897.1 hypothetical protein APD13_15275 [Acinetobacter pittii]